MKKCERHGPARDPYCVDCFRETAEKVTADAEGHAAGVAGKKMDANPYGENDELHWVWLRGWVGAGLEKHCPTNDKLSHGGGNEQ